MINWGAIRSGLMIRQGEGRIVLYLAGLAMLVGGGLAIGRGSSDALFFKRFGTQYLPHMFFATSFLLVLASALYGQVADRWHPGKVLMAMTATVAGLLGGNWLLMQFGGSAYAFVLYFLIYAVASEILLVHFSFFVSSYFHVQQNKRLSPLVNAASRLGAVFGGLLLGGLVQIWPAPGLALVWAATLLAIMAAVVVRLRRGEANAVVVHRKSARRGGGLLGAFYFARRSSLLRIASLGAFLLIVLISLQDYIVATLLTRHFAREEDLTAFFGLFFASSNALVLVLQMAVTNRLLHRYGLRAVNLIFPWSTLATFSLLALAPGVVTATLARFNYAGMLPAFRNPAANLFFAALPAYMQGRARALILGVVLPAGLAVAGLGLMFVPATMVDRELPLLGGALALAFVAVKIRKNVAYSNSLTELIRQQVFSEKTFVEAEMRMDRRVAQKLAAVIPGGDAATAQALIEVLCAHAPQDAGALLLKIAPAASPAVQDRILRALQRLRPAGWLDYARGLLGHEDLHLVGTALEVLAQAGDAAAIEGARNWQRHEKPRPKAAALGILKNAGTAGEREAAGAGLLAMLASFEPQECIAAAQAIAALRDAAMIDHLKPLLAAGDGRVRAAGLHAYSGLAESLGRDCAGPVAAALGDGLEAVREAAVKRLAAVHEDGLRLSLLARALDDASPAVRRSARALAAELIPASAASLAAAFAEHFHHFGMQGLLAGASQKLDPQARDALLEEAIRRHLAAASQKRQAAARLMASGRLPAAGRVLLAALGEEAHEHVCTAMDMLAERLPGEAIHQAACALRSTEAGIRAQGLESLQCLSDNALAREIAELAERPEPGPPKPDQDRVAIEDMLAPLAATATPWLRECMKAFSHQRSAVSQS